MASGTACSRVRGVATLCRRPAPGPPLAGAFLSLSTPSSLAFAGQPGQSEQGRSANASKGSPIEGPLYKLRGPAFREEPQAQRPHCGPGMRGGLAMDLSVLLPAQHTSPSPAQRSSSAAWPLGSTPGGEQTASEASALDPHQCPSHQTTSPPSPGNFLRSLHVPDLCPRSVLRGQFVPLALSSGTSGACVIRNEYDNVAADRQSAPRSPFDLPRSHQPASRSPPGLSGGLAVMGAAPDPRPALTSSANPAPPP